MGDHIRHIDGNPSLFLPCGVAMELCRDTAGTPFVAIWDRFGDNIEINPGDVEELSDWLLQFHEMLVAGVRTSTQGGMDDAEGETESAATEAGTDA